MHEILKWDVPFKLKKKEDQKNDEYLVFSFTLSMDQIAFANNEAGTQLCEEVHFLLIKILFKSQCCWSIHEAGQVL